MRAVRTAATNTSTARGGFELRESRRARVIFKRSLTSIRTILVVLGEGDGGLFAYLRRAQRVVDRIAANYINYLS